MREWTTIYVAVTESMAGTAVMLARDLTTEAMLAEGLGRSRPREVR